MSAASPRPAVIETRDLGKVYAAATGKAVEKAGEYDVIDLLGGEF